jgi:threonylcarbamoyladenosine tRNA methylthiotransferase MtaB
MQDQLPPQVKTARVEQLSALEVEMRDRYYSSLLGRRLRVLIESPLENQPGKMLGTACRYAPIELPGDVSMRKQFADVIAARLVNDRIVAQVGV